MGIPSYFSYIVRNYPSIIKSVKTTNILVDYFYLDSNSIIYDIVKSNEHPFKEKIIIDKVIQKICDYIKIISPKKLAYIAFDGVAPIAKLEQQRQRRYKSSYQCNLINNLNAKKTIEWNTCQITPGTLFMNELNRQIQSYFQNPRVLLSLEVDSIIVSTSVEEGEGEHKIYHYMRNLSTTIQKETTHVIYGLDADLIMLSINHLPMIPKIYLFRETPEFIKSVSNELEPNERYFMDINELADKIVHLNMKKECILSSLVKYDYIFICFFLGNDFMPHFPSMNIRTGGIDKLLNAYTQKNIHLTDGKNIDWDNLFTMLSLLSKREQQMFVDEMRLRDKKEMYCKNIPEDTVENKWRKIDNIPTYERDVEKYIDPKREGWQKRYYHALFQIKSKDMNTAIPDIVLNYLEGLEWTMKYYMGDCVDWTWRYRYSYPPLLEDLVKYGKGCIPKIQFKQNTKAVSSLVQLCYVMPHSGLEYIPSQIKHQLLTKHRELYPDECEFIWAFCRYFWESHAQLPEIPMELIEKIVVQYKKKKS
jgi:5'-3' exoribonuclease 1